jgi:predicted RNA-binding Zn ribbon-like protein
MARWYRRLDVSDPVTPRMAYASETEAQGERVLAAIADSAIEILAGPDRARLRICKAPSCGMFFLEGRAGQQWCTVSCGNRARVARHYKRSKPALDGDGLSSAR